jgi:hypothetical protein
MTYDGEDNYTLSTGRTFYANNGIIGLAPDDDDPHEGYDGSIRTTGYEEGDESTWSQAERRELADEMIRRWNAWAVAQNG